MKKIFKTLIAFILIIQPFTSYAETFVAHCRDYPPELSYQNNTCVGAIPDLMTDLLQELGHEITWIKVPWIRSVKVAKEGKVDLLIRHSMTQERELFLNAIPYGYGSRELSFYKSPNFSATINSYDDVKKYNIGAIRGNFYSPEFSMLDTNILVLVGKTEQLIKMLERGRIDLAVTSKSHSEEKFKGRFIKATFTDTFDNPLYISIPKSAKCVQYYQDIAELMLDYRKSGKINQYFIKYGLPEPKQLFN